MSAPAAAATLTRFPRLSLALRAGIPLALLAVVLVRVRPGEVLRAVGQIEPLVLALAGVLAGVGITVQWAKWRDLTTAALPGTTPGQALQTLLVGFGLGLVSPGRLGELGRGAFESGERRTAMAALTAADRLCSAAVTVTAAWIALLTVAPGTGLAAGCLAGGAGAAGWRCRDRLARWRPVRAIAGLFAPVARVPRETWLRLGCWSVLFNAVFLTQFALLLGPLAAPWPRLVQAVPLVFGLKTLVPFSVLDLGVREAAAVLVFTRFGFDPAPALGAALWVFILNVLIPGAAGLAEVYRQAARFGNKNLR